MASLSFAVLFLSLSFCVLLFSPTHSLTCTSQKFTANKLFANCTDLPTLSSYLHYTYNSSNSSLSVAFVAPPAKPDGWIGWGINPNGTGMVGAQVILALKSSKGTPAVKTYNLVSYGDIREEKLSFEVWDLSAESNATSGDFILFASVKVPGKPESLNHIWQVGAAVNNGMPAKHDLAPANKDAKATLKLVAAQGSGKTAAPAPTSADGNTTSGTTSATNTTSPTGSKDSGRGYRIREMNVGLYFGLLVLLGSFISF